MQLEDGVEVVGNDPSHYNGNCCSVHLTQELCSECGGCILCGDGKIDCPVCS